MQSADITGNYQDTWEAYARELDTIPDWHHGMNWANVWKRLIPQLMLKGAVASTSKLCTKGLYFVVPKRVFIQFEKILGKVPEVHRPGQGVLTVMTYELGPELTDGSIRELKLCRVKRMKLEDFVQSFASGKQLPLGAQLDEKVLRMLEML
ncbi:MAG: hypothetical protein IMW97_02175 [Firmicutes bacterium]|nr:hypothetical protein [Candidatus Fermentithermobacillaceae bacterium]